MIPVVEFIIEGLAKKFRKERLFPWYLKQEADTQVGLGLLACFLCAGLFWLGLNLVDGAGGWNNEWFRNERELEQWKKGFLFTIMGALGTLSWIILAICFIVDKEWTRKELPQIFIRNSTKISAVGDVLIILTILHALFGPKYTLSDIYHFWLAGVLGSILYLWGLMMAWRHKRLNPVIKHCPICTCTLLPGEDTCTFCDKMSKKPKQ